jgi:hypothetical protein
MPASSAFLMKSLLSSSLSDQARRRAGMPASSAVPKAPAAYIGWSEPAARYCLVGNLVGTNEPVALDLDNPKAVGVFGYMGSGKSYLLGTLIESGLVPIAGINSLPAPLAVVIFNYRRHSADRFELGSLAHPNSDRADRERLERLYGASPRSVEDIHILCLPGQLTPERVVEYGGLPASELFFDPTTLGVEDWELLMGEPGSNAVFARAIRNTLMDLQAAGDVSLESLERSIATLNRSSQSAAQLKLDFDTQPDRITFDGHPEDQKISPTTRRFSRNAKKERCDRIYRKKPGEDVASNRHPTLRLSVAGGGKQNPSRIKMPRCRAFLRTASGLQGRETYSAASQLF